MHGKRTLTILLASALMLLAARGGFANQQVTWYSVLDAPTLDALVGLFNKTHPGIVLHTLRIGSNLMPSRVMTERMAGRTTPIS